MRLLGGPPVMVDMARLLESPLPPPPLPVTELAPTLPRRTRARISDLASCDVIEVLEPRRERPGRGVELPLRGVIDKKGSGAAGDLRGDGAGVG